MVARGDRVLAFPPMRARHPMVAVGGALALGLAVAGCFEPVDTVTCRRDRDCPEAVCTNVGECAATTYPLRVGWTLRGATANQPGACDRVDELEVVLQDPSTGMDFSVRPVPCGIGSMLFDKLPLGYGTATVTAYGTRGEYLSSATGSTDPSVGAIMVDLRP